VSRRNIFCIREFGALVNDVWLVPSAVEEEAAGTMLRICDDAIRQKRYARSARLAEQG